MNFYSVLWSPVSLSFSLPVCLVYQDTMVLKNFFFMENWVRSEVAGMKIAFFAIFDLTWTHILAPKRL